MKIIFWRLKHKKALDFIRPFLAMAMLKQAWHRSSGLTKTFFDLLIQQTLKSYLTYRMDGGSTWSCRSGSRILRGLA